MRKVLISIKVFYKRRIALYQRVVLMGFIAGLLLAFLISPLFSIKTEEPFLFHDPVTLADYGKVAKELDRLQVKYEKVEVEEGIYILITDRNDPHKVASELEKNAKLCLSFK